MRKTIIAILSLVVGLPVLLIAGVIIDAEFEISKGRFWQALDYQMNSKACDRYDYKKAVELVDLANRSYQSSFGAISFDDTKASDVNTTLRGYVFNLAVRANYEMAYCRGEISLQDISNRCDEEASPRFGDHRAPRVMGATRLGSFGICWAAADLILHEGLITYRQYLRTLYEFMLRYPDKLQGCYQDDCPSDKLRRGISVASGEIEYAAFYCQAQMLDGFRRSNNGLKTAREAWDILKDGDAAFCVASYYHYGSPPEGLFAKRDIEIDLNEALIWYRRAQSVGVDAADRINTINREIEISQVGQKQSTQKPAYESKPSGFTAGEIVAGGIAGVLAGACLWHEGCREIMGEAAKKAAIDLAVKKMMER